MSAPESERLTLEISWPFERRVVTVEWVAIVSPSGNFVVGPGHRPLFSLISAGKSIRYSESGAESVVEIAQAGFCTVKDNQVTLVIP